MKLPQVISKQLKTSNIFSSAIQKIKSLLPSKSEIIDLGGGVIIDIKNKKIIIPDGFNIHSSGTLKIETEKHLILSSSEKPTGENGMVYSIWLNPDLDDNGNPIPAAISDSSLILDVNLHNHEQIHNEEGIELINKVK